MARSYSCIGSATRTTCLLIGIALFSTPNYAATPGIAIETPAPGTVVRPGQYVDVQVSVDTLVLQPRIIKIDAYTKPGGPIIETIELMVPPYEARVPVPMETTGAMYIWVHGWTTTEKAIYGPTRTLQIVPDQVPMSLDVETSNLFHLQKSTTDPVDTETLRVAGNYADGTYRNITGSLFGTTYTSSDTSVATVDAEGVVTPVSPGFAYISVEHKGLKVFSQVRVQPSTGFLPPVDQTSKVNIQAGGFRLDREKGAYVQQVTITNVSLLPIPKSLKLILTGLPNGVRLYQSNSKTENILPLGSPWLFIDLDTPSFMPPGHSTTLTIEFVNMTGIPITYTPKVYTTSHP